jgi:hypothetical protein
MGNSLLAGSLQGFFGRSDDYKGFLAEKFLFKQGAWQWAGVGREQGMCARQTANCSN